MKANRVKTRILPVLDEVIAYLTNKSLIKRKPATKSSIFQQLVAKKVQNL